MTGLLLDTTLIVELLKGELSAEAKQLLQQSNCFISIITFFETCRHVHQIGKGSQWESLKDRIIGFNIIGVGSTTAEQAAILSARQRLSTADSIIYATALSRGLTLVTFDNDFRNKKNALVLRK